MGTFATTGDPQSGADRGPADQTRASTPVPHRWPAVRNTRRPAALLLASALGLAACAGTGTTESTDAGSASIAEPAAPAPSTTWDPLMAAPGTAPLPAAVAGSAQAALDDYLEETGLVGVTAAVVHADGVWEGAAGSDGNGDPLLPESAMALGDVTRTFTTAAVMGLAEDGAVDLATPIDDYIDLPFETNGATVGQLLNLRSGFPGDRLMEPVNMATLQSDLDRAWTVAEVLDLHAGATDSDGDTGGVQAYNAVNFWALQVLVEEVSGQPIAEVVRSTITGPAGLDETWWQDAEEPQTPLTVGVDPAGTTTISPDGAWLPSRSWASAAGAASGMASTAADAARWGYLLYGSYLLRPESVEQLTASGQPEGYPCEWDYLVTCFYGLGTKLHEDGSVGHEGRGLAYQSELRVWSEDDLAVAVLVPATLLSANYGSPWLGELAADLRDAVLSG